jgi:hypothetical protein
LMRGVVEDEAGIHRMGRIKARMGRMNGKD